ncbi:YqhA family protein [uncultured Methanobrevibacter sp.]|uniref:YqhA family protein n=1 Tax=uncultured Methanobrevibacter sp. TaxID=253161 RepID=UPI002628395A|nr:YqhA family protein [uncultured Methanobrevibacter sp.]
MIEISEKRPTFEVVDVENVKDEQNADNRPSNQLHNSKHRLESKMEWLLYNSRWILSLMYLLLIVVLAVILIKFGMEAFDFFQVVWGLEDNDWIIRVLELLDLTLVANLVLIVAFSGYENFVSKIDNAEKGHDTLPWMGELDFSGLKLKIIGSIVAISLIELLQDFLNATSHIDPNFEFWRIVLHIIFVITGVAFAGMELLSEKKEETKAKEGLIEKQKKVM